MKVAVVGATGLVGTKMIEILEERKFPITEFLAVASEKSVGNKVIYNKKEYSIISLEAAVAEKPDIALFSAGGSVSLEWAPKFAAAGTIVIDNSSAWRMDNTKKLIVPEVNGNIINKEDKIIANPNCSTIQMVMVLKPIHDKYKIQRVVVSTYQSVSGSGQKGVNHLNGERKKIDHQKLYPHPIDMNVIPHIDVFTEDGYTKEEIKMMLETKKIMGDESIKVSATTVRVPVVGGHSESVNISCEIDFTRQEIINLLKQAPGVVVQDNVENNEYPMPVYAENKDEVFVGRIRKDESYPNTLNCWIVADNLRKGAATNAVQIAEYIYKNIM